jgi:hypothetical protein
MSLALALTDMLPPSAVPSLFRYDLEQLAETIATKGEDVGRLVREARRHLQRLGIKRPGPARADSS